MVRLLSIAAVLLLAACGGGSPSITGTAQATGTIDGINFTGLPLVEATASGYVLTEGCNSAGVATGLAILLSSQAGMCSAYEANENIGGNTYIGIDIEELGSNLPAIPTGTYQITSAAENDSNGNSYAADLQYATQDNSCNQTVGDYAESGTITLTSINGGAVQGSFNVTRGSETLQGTFDTAGCSLNGSQIFCDVTHGCSH